MREFPMRTGAVRDTHFMNCHRLLLCIFFCSALSLRAQTVTPDQEYGRYLTTPQTISPVTEFGDQISLRDGALSFLQTDVELLGTGPAIRFVRSFSVIGRTGNGGFSDSSGNTIGEWEIVVPRLKTLTNNNSVAVTPSSPVGWQVGEASNARCTQIDRPGIVASTNPKLNSYESDTWWAGYQLVDDLGNETGVLGRSPSTGEPAYVARTKSNWVIACLPSTANGEPGEAFLAIAPNGTRYWLDYLVYRNAPAVKVPGPGMGALSRRYASMLVTRIEDRFGNWVNYQYEAGALRSIVASDGRKLAISDNGAGTVLLTALSASGSRTWRYSYNGNALTSVLLPDGTSWQFSLANLWAKGMPLSTSGNCYGAAQRDGLSGETSSGSITSPSGATATYSVRILHIGRSYVPISCWSEYPSEELYAEIPKDTWSYAIVSKAIDGPAVGPLSWSYSYSPGNSSSSAECGGGCVSSVWTEVTGPDGVRHRSVFSNKFGGDEGLILKEETFSVEGVLVKSIDYSYAITPPNEVNSPYPWRSVGFDFTPRSNWQVSERWAPVQSTTIVQDGVMFRSFVNSFDVYARPLIVTKASSATP